MGSYACVERTSKPDCPDGFTPHIPNIEGVVAFGADTLSGTKRFRLLKISYPRMFMASPLRQFSHGLYWIIGILLS
jgi:hypothetical protein